MLDGLVSFMPIIEILAGAFQIDEKYQTLLGGYEAWSMVNMPPLANDSVGVEITIKELAEIRGQTYYDLRLVNEARRDCDKAIELASMLSYSYNNRGALFLDLKRHQEALNDFNPAIAISSAPTLLSDWVPVFDVR